MLQMVVAYSRNRAIGKDNKLLWHLTEDMKFFKELTSGACVVMGKNTYMSLPPKFRPLPNRLNIVLTKSKDIVEQENLKIVSSIDLLLEYIETQAIETIYIIGGAQIYKQLLPYTSIIYATEVEVEIEGDAYFPELIEGMWISECIKTVPKDEKNDFNFSILKYSKK